MLVTDPQDHSAMQTTSGRPPHTQSKHLWFHVSTKPNSADTKRAWIISLLPAVRLCAMFVTRRRQWLLIEESVTFMVFQYICMSGRGQHWCLRMNMHFQLSSFADQLWYRTQPRISVGNESSCKMKFTAPALETEPKEHPWIYSPWTSLDMDA